MKWLIVAALVLLVAVMVKGQLDFNKLMRSFTPGGGTKPPSGGATGGF